MAELRKGLSPMVVSGRIEMRTPDEVSAMLAVKACGWAYFSRSRSRIRRIDSLSVGTGGSLDDHENRVAR